MKKPLTILYVEDEVLSRRVMEMVTAFIDDVTLTMFEDSTNFLARVKALTPQPNLIFLDIHLKPHNGFEMLEMLRRQSEFDHTPIVAMTASVMNEEVQRLRTAGFNGCLAKPIDMDSFPDTVMRILNGEHIWRITN